MIHPMCRMDSSTIGRLRAGCHARSWLALTFACAAAASAADPGALPERLAGPPRLQTFGIAQGLSQSSVTAIVQDERGFLWVGTQAGLNRFDGYEFRRYLADPDDPLALDDATITALAVHPSGSVWIGTQQEGVAHHDPRHDIFVHLRHPGGRADPSWRRVTALAVDTAGAVWIGTRGGLARVAPDDSPAAVLQVLDDRAVASLFAAPTGHVWVGRQSGVLEVYQDLTAHAPTRRLLPFDGPVPIRAITEDRNGTLWLAGDADEIVRIDAEGTMLRRHRLRTGPHGESPRLRALVVDGDGRAWVGGLATGIAVVDPSSGRTRELRRSAFDPHGLSDDDVLALHLDTVGTLWIGTLSGGLVRLRQDEAGFGHYWHRPDDASSLSHDVVTSFSVQPDGALWIGTDGGGLNRLVPGTDRFERLALPGSAPGAMRIWALHTDRTGGLWIGTWGAGLHRRATADAPFQAVPGLPATIVTAIAEDPDGLWIGSVDAGVTRLAPDGTVRMTMLEDHNVAALLVDGDELWAGLWTDGLVRLSRSGRVLEHLQHRPDDPHSLPHDSVRDLLLDRAGALWAATGAGLARLDRASGQVERFGAAAGLPTGTVYSVTEDDAGHLWLSTNAGLVRFDPASGGVREFLPDDGVQDHEFTTGARLRLPDGQLVFGGVRGFNLFDPRRLVPAGPPGRVEIVDVLLANVTVRPRAREADSPLEVTAPELESLTLGHRDTQLAIRFALPLPETPAQITYAYQLEGLDIDWRRARADQRTAVYSNLAPGRYMFRVRARNADGEWSTVDRTLALQIQPPWWASPWAYAGYAIAALLALLAFVQWRTLSLRHRSRVLKARVAERTVQLSRQNELIEEQARQLQHALETKERLFARVSHEFRTPLTLILGPIESLLADERDGRTVAWLKLMRRSARRLLVLVDQLLGLAHLSGEAPLQVSPQRVASVLRGTVAAFGSAAVARGVALDLDRLDDPWVPATPEALERIVANLVANAVKYTPAGGHVRASLRDEGGTAAIVVADDGPGIAADEQARMFEPFQRGAVGDGTGLGLALVRESAQALGGSVHLRSAPGQGATFTVRLPTCLPPMGSTDATDADLTSERVLLESAVLSGDLHRTDDAGLAASLIDAAPADDRPRILLVEDNADLRALLLATLAPDYRCTTAADGRTGVEQAVEDPPDLVISDVLMPGLDGFELTQALKRDERSSHVPIVLLTALGDRDSRLHGLAERADDYLVKPFDADELRLRIRNLIESREIARQRAARRVYDMGRPIADTGAVDEAAHGPREQAFLERLRAAALRGHAESAFGVAELAARVAMSERQLQRKLRALLGVSPAEYLRELRLQQAAVRLRRGEPAGNVAMDVGFASPSHFGACFKARYGVTPGEFRSSGGR